MRSLLLRCYPARWRARYGDEFEAILEERPLGPFDVADILLGALDAHLRMPGRATNVALEGRIVMSLRIGGIAAIIGGGLFGTAAIVGSGVIGNADPAPGLLVIAGALVLLVAVAGLSAFQARAHPVVVWVAFLVAASGTIVCLLGAAERFGDASWNMIGVGLIVMTIGYVLFAMVTLWTAALSRPGAMLLLVGPALVAVGIVWQALAIPIVVPDGTATVGAIAAIGGFVLGWFALGIQAIRLDRHATTPNPA